jgi:hypothetical protein
MQPGKKLGHFFLFVVLVLVVVVVAAVAAAFSMALLGQMGHQIAGFAIAKKGTAYHLVATCIMSGQDIDEEACLIMFCRALPDHVLSGLA